LSLSCLHNLIGEFDLRESVHGAFNLVASDILHSSQEISNQACSFLERIKQRLMLPQVTDSGRFLDILNWRIAHKIDHQLANRVRTQVNAFQFDQLVRDLWVEVMNVHVTSSESAFAQKSLWDRMHRDELAIVFVLGRHWVQDSVGWDEHCALLVNVLSVNLELAYNLLSQKSARSCSWLKTQWSFELFQR
jgi:hypothetical protein